MKFRLLSALVAFAFILLSHLSNAQSPQAAKANEDAYSLYSNGKYTEAAAAYEKLLKDYPTDVVVSAAYIQLAFTDYFLGDFTKAEAALTKASSGPPLPAELKQISDGFLPQILSAKAASLGPTDPARKTAYEQAITKFGEFISKYPTAPDIENAIYGKAVAEFSIQKYDEAAKDLETNIQKFPTSGTIPTSRNLLAITLATQGSMELAKGDAADKAKGFALLKKSSGILQDIINKKEDIALINDANFQLGEILFNQAAFSDEAARPAIYQQAMEAYRAIAPKEQIIDWQKQQIDSIMQKIREAGVARNAPLVAKLGKDNERERKKMEELKAKPDQTATALLKMGEIYFQQASNKNPGVYNEARVVLQHATPFLTKDEEKKRALYFTTMTYAFQNAKDKAVKGYTDFNVKYKGDPLADNLPLAMGNMFTSVGDAPGAVKYFDESLSIYPKGQFAGQTVVFKAEAEGKLGNSDAALKTFRDYLAGNPPPEIAVIARNGIAGIFKDQRKWDEAIAAYKELKEKSAGTPQATDADYWIAVAIQQKGDPTAAIPLFEAFVTANPQNPLASMALYAEADAQSKTNKAEDGFKTLTRLADTYPDSPAAPFTYFARAQIRAQQQNADAINELMRQFIKNYPKHDNVYFAYESIAKNAVNAQKQDEAITTYKEFIDKYPDSVRASTALYSIADLQRVRAEKIGRNYTALKPEEQAEWKKHLEDSVASTEELIKRFPDSTELALALRNLLTTQNMLLSAGIKTDADVEAYFKNLAESAPTPAAKSKILFAQAAYVSLKDQKRSLEIMGTAYDPNLVFSPQDLDTYGLALIKEGRLDDGQAVFQKLAKDYPVPANVTPGKEPPTIQEAQATALFGQGRVAQEKKQTAEAGKLFERLKVLYPWSPKVLEANYGIAQSLSQQGKADEALTLLAGISRAENATAELRANSMLLLAQIYAEKAKTATDPKEKAKFMSNAIDNFIKVADRFPGVPAAAVRGLWDGGQLLEEQAAASSDAAFKTQQTGRAKSAYQQILKDYPNSEFAPKAKARLTALGVQ